MKKIAKSFILVAATAMGFTACQKEMQEDKPASDSTIQVTFVAGTPITRTTVDTSGEDKPVFSWDENETFAVLEQTDALAEATQVIYNKDDEGKANITATFAANAGHVSYDYVTIYPASGYVSSESIAAATLSLPAVQTMAESSYDPAADLMVSEIVSTTAQPEGTQMVGFTRMAAVVKMTLKNFTPEEGDEVEQVIFTAEGKNLAGTITADLADPHKFTVAEGVDNVTVNTTSATDVYFTVLPAALEVGDAYTVTVITNKKLYIKKGTIPEGKTLEFKKGMVTRLGVSMDGVAPSEKWVLVRDASTLEAGDVVTIAAKDYEKALSTKLYNNVSETSTSARRDAADVSKYLDFLIINENVQPFILVQGAAEGTYAFYDATRKKFLVSSNKSSRYLINQPYVDLNTSFAISTVAEDGDATVKNTAGDFKDNMIRYYNSSKYFYSGTSANQAICIYKQAGVEGDIPTVSANITVPDSDESVVIAEEGAAVATAISTDLVTFNYVGDWTIEVATEAQWLDVAYDAEKNCLTYTAEANTEAKRETTVTITASMEGEEPLTWSFNVLQKGAPQDISIADFVKLVKDENSTYRITGRITEMTLSSSGTFKLTDGENVATVTYLYTDGGDKVSGSDAINVAVGDVMTVTTVPVGSGKGGNSSHYSIYKGHYGFKTELGLAAEYTGGSVEIKVETYSNGNITVPESLEATMAENDYAELSYSGGETATVTFATENETSYAREAEVTFTYGLCSATVTAQQGINPANKLGYELVTDHSTLALGDEIIIVAKTADKALGVSTSTITSQTTFPSASIVKSGNVIYDAEEAGAVVFTLADAGAADKFALQFTHKTSSYYLYIGSTSLKGSTSLGSYTKLSIEIDSTSGVATIVNSAGTAALVTYNETSAKFGSTKEDDDDPDAAEDDIVIYRKQK